MTFPVEEIIVSKTDLTGRITYANDAFVRISGYSEAETIGQPHSFIRHPHMPRCIFRLLWDSLQAGKEIFAYIFNMTKTGDHYWVLAHVTPTFDEQARVTGFHSNRRCPDRGAVERMKGVYARLLEIERGRATKSDAIAASLQELQRVVSERHASYEEFIFALQEGGGR